MISALLCFFESTPGLAAWVQAIGGILAILGAYFIGERQASKELKNSQKLARDQERERRVAILEVAKMAMQSAQKIDEIFSSAKDIDLVTRMLSEYHPKILDGRVAALAAIPLHTLGSSSAVAALLDLRDQLEFLQVCVQRWQQERASATEQKPATDNVWAKNVHNNFSRIQAHYRTMEEALLK